MKDIIISPEAKIDLTDCYEYLAQNYPNSALRFFDATRITFAELARYPESGARYRSSSRPELRKWRVKGFSKYLILYLPQENAIEIVRVLYGAQDLDRILNV